MAIDRSAIEAQIHRGWTGNRHKDLVGFKLGEEFDAADEAWHRESQVRFEEQEQARRTGWRR